MKIKLLRILFLAVSVSAYSQVGIGTTNPHSSSILELSSANSGLLIPRVNLSSIWDNWTISNPQTSLLVYNLTNNGSITPGFYFWDGSWKTLKGEAGATGPTGPAGPTSGGGSGWNLTGNTIGDTEYIGTNNYKSLFMRVNGSQFSKYHPNGGTAIGLNAAANDNSSIAIGNGASATNSNQATAVGPSTNASGYRSTAIGYNARASNNNAYGLGDNASASGQNSFSLGSSSSATTNNSFAFGTNSTASGQQAFAIGQSTNASGQNSLSMGNGASSSAEQSFAIGHGASATAQNAMAIGHQAQSGQANAIVLGNSGNNNNRVGIGTNTPDERLHIVGNLKIVDGNQAAGRVLVSDANGKGTWTNTESQKVYCELYKTNNTNLDQYNPISLGGNGIAQGATQGGPVIQVISSGIYRITYTVSIRKLSGSAISPEFYLAVNGSEVTGSRTFTTVGNGESASVSITKLVNLNAYQSVGIRTTVSDNNTVVLANGTNMVLEKI